MKLSRRLINMMIAAPAGLAAVLFATPAAAASKIAIDFDDFANKLGDDEGDADALHEALDNEPVDHDDDSCDSDEPEVNVDVDVDPPHVNVGDEGSDEADEESEAAHEDHSDDDSDDDDDSGDDGGDDGDGDDDDGDERCDDRRER